MNVEYADNSARITDDNGFIPEQVFENGQFFRFNKKADGDYDIFAGDRRLNVRREDGALILSGCSPEDFESFWGKYLDLDTDYKALFKDTADDNLKFAMKKYPGLKVLKQDPYETVISFIISANNNIGRIKGIIERICAKYGDKTEDSAGEFFAFPTAERLSHAAEEELRELGCGYRAPYIAETAKAIANGFDLESLKNTDYLSAKKRLLELKGVGPKVADCILLFSLNHYNAFPKDVWVKRVLDELYGIKGSDKDVQLFAEKRFGKYAGIAQQYLFYAARRGELEK